MGQSRNVSCGLLSRGRSGKSSGLERGQDEVVLRLSRSPKIVDHIKKWDPQCRLATFKAAGPNTSGEQLVAICRRQLERTGSDFVFGNVIGALQLTATVVDEFGAESFDSREAAIQNLCARLLSL